MYSLVHYTTHVLEKYTHTTPSLHDNPHSSRSHSFAIPSHPSTLLNDLQTSLFSSSLALLYNYTTLLGDTHKATLLHQPKSAQKGSVKVAPCQLTSEAHVSLLSMICEFTMKPKMESNDEVFADVISFLGAISDCPSVRGSIMKV